MNYFKKKVSNKFLEFIDRLFEGEEIVATIIIMTLCMIAALIYHSYY